MRNATARRAGNRLARDAIMREPGRVFIVVTRRHDGHPSRRLLSPVTGRRLWLAHGVAHRAAHVVLMQPTSTAHINEKGEP
ncbi:hypothetical protein [Metallibacterium sp.]|jgi:hypothetical protein|uniref:hypothetical protein n=1 Tax=Metallibacterium sp. TaxID=2940281 RepID=UPI00260B3DC0|nr:hypothetical protein [Metallibacterium sp.]